MLPLTDADATPPPGVKRPKYLVLADSIRSQISDGYLQPGEKLSGELALAQMTGVARSVVRQALTVLVREGAIEGRNGVGWRVAPAAVVRMISMARYGEQDALIDGGKRPETSAFATGHGIAWDEYTVDFTASHELGTPLDCELLELPMYSGVHVWRRSFVKYAAGVPVELQRSALPERVVEGNEFLIDPAQQPYLGGTQWELYDAGHRVGQVSQKTETRMPTENEERHLRIRQVPVLDVRRIFYDRDGRPVEASRLVLPGPKHVMAERLDLVRRRPRR